MTYEEYQQRFKFNQATDVLGQGGSGSVVKAWDFERNELVALKIAPVRPDLEQFSLLQEYERVRHLRHPNIAIYHECYRLLFPGLGSFDVAGMKFYPDGHLGQLLGRQRLEAAQKAILLQGVLKGLDYLHSRDPFIIHCDIKPENVLIVPYAENFTPLISDFGISRQGLEFGPTNVTNTKKAQTLYYAPPEQGQAAELHRNVDLWSYGVLVAYVWLDGQLPFRTEGLNLTTSSGVEQMRSRIRSLDLVPEVATVPEPWQRVLRACLVVDPAQRVRSVADVRDLLSEQTRELKPAFVNGQEAEARRDYVEARLHYQEAADQQHAGAMYHLGCLYDKGQGGPPDKAKARTWWEAAASLGNVDAQQKIQDLDKQTKAEETQVLGDTGSKKEPAAAVNEDTKKPQVGVPLRPNKRSENSTESTDARQPLRPIWIGVAVPLFIAVLFYGFLKWSDTHRSETHDTDHSVAAMPPTSTTVADTAEIVDAAAAPETVFVAPTHPAAKGSADLLEIGDGFFVMKNYQRAKIYYERAANLGNSNAIYNLGYLYQNGLGVMPDYSHARNLYQRAAASGNPAARYSLRELRNQSQDVK